MVIVDKTKGVFTDADGKVREVTVHRPRKEIPLQVVESIQQERTTELRAKLIGALAATPHKILKSLVGNANSRQLKEIEAILPHVTLTGAARYVTPEESNRVNALVNRVSAEIAKAVMKREAGMKRHNRRFQRG